MTCFVGRSSPQTVLRFVIFFTHSVQGLLLVVVPYLYMDSAEEQVAVEQPQKVSWWRYLVYYILAIIFWSFVVSIIMNILMNVVFAVLYESFVVGTIPINLNIFSIGIMVLTGIFSVRLLKTIKAVKGKKTFVISLLVPLFVAILFAVFSLVSLFLVRDSVSTILDLSESVTDLQNDLESGGSDGITIPGTVLGQ